MKRKFNKNKSRLYRTNPLFPHAGLVPFGGIGFRLSVAMPFQVFDEGLAGGQFAGSATQFLRSFRHVLILI